MLIVAVVTLASCISNAQAPSALNEKDDIINNSRIMRWKSRQMGISAMPAPQRSDAKTQVYQSIKQLQSLRLPIPKQTALDIQSVQAFVQMPVAQQAVSAPPKPYKTQTSKARGSDETARVLAVLMDNPQNIIDPLPIAEALFHHGNIKDAAKFYQLALKHMDMDDETVKTDHPNRPWTLFQAANCIRPDDPLEAYKVYEQLIAEYPNSNWTAAARARQKVITWYQQNKPANVLEKYISEPNSL
jgi:tetratricopeptide (TPR) repeat protein